VTPNGALALTTDNGNHGTSDGNVDTVSVIDLAAKPPRVIDHIMVPDSPEGLATSPAGNLAAVIEANGSNKDRKSFMYHRGGIATILLIKGKKVTRLKDIEVGALPEAACFTPDGRFLYVGNFINEDFSILRVRGTRVTDTGKRFKVPGHPASARCSVH
jgi:DNA-binding beta-propeller fold protein YncE